MTETQPYLVFGADILPLTVKLRIYDASLGNLRLQDMGATTRLL